MPKVSKEYKKNETRSISFKKANYIDMEIYLLETDKYRSQFINELIEDFFKKKKEKK